MACKTLRYVWRCRSRKRYNITNMSRLSVFNDYLPHLQSSYLVISMKRGWHHSTEMDSVPATGK